LPNTIESFIDYRIKRRGGILFVAAEGVASIGLRFEAMLAKKLRLPNLDHNPPQPFAWVNFQPQLLRLGANGLIAIAEREAAWMREKFAVDLTLIVVDTVAAAAAFQKEDDAAQAQAVMSEMGLLSKKTGALVLGVDHFGKDVDTGTRGSSAKEGYAETVLALVGKREVTGRVTDLQLGVRKVRDGDQGRVVPFRLELVDCGTDEDSNHHPGRAMGTEPAGTTGRAAAKPSQRAPSRIA
jgi:AAA domain